MIREAHVDGGGQINYEGFVKLPLQATDAQQEGAEEFTKIQLQQLEEDVAKLECHKALKGFCDCRKTGLPGSVFTEENSRAALAAKDDAMQQVSALMEAILQLKAQATGSVLVEVERLEVSATEFQGYIDVLEGFGKWLAGRQCGSAVAGARDAGAHGRPRWSDM